MKPTAKKPKLAVIKKRKPLKKGDKLPPDAPRRGGRKNTNWNKWEDLYVTNQTPLPLRIIAKRSGLNQKTVEARAAADSWVEKRREFFMEASEKFREMAQLQIAEAKLRNVELIREAKHELRTLLTIGSMEKWRASDLVALIKEEMHLLGEPESSTETTSKVDEKTLEQAIIDSIRSGKIDRHAMRRATKNS